LAYEIGQIYRLSDIACGLFRCCWWYQE